MSSGAPTDRHLALSGVRRYLYAGIPGDILVPGSPEAYLLVAAAGRSISILVRAAGSAAVPDLHAYQHLDADTVHWRQEHWLRLSVRTLHRLEDLYPLLCLVLDAIQLHGRSFATAINEALDAYREMLVQRGALSEARQIGLLGELLALKHLTRALGATRASAAWVAGDNEEHDFALDHVDVEVKTTAASRRAHWISSTTQLEPKPWRSLYLLSFQITRAGLGEGYTLPELVNLTRAQAGSAEPEVSQNLIEAGYRDQDADLYPTRWSLRDRPVVYLVDTEFPALVPSRLAAIVPQSSLVTALSYQLDLQTYQPSEPPEELLGLTVIEERIE